MSRAAGFPFHKPAPFEFPRPPLSPPDTNTDIIGPSHMMSSNSATGAHELRQNEPEPSPAYPSLTPESAGARFRKISSIAYHNSGLKESRDRVPQRSPKAFVIVIPPATFTQEHGQLGHTLSSGPRYRLAQGLIMPLFPTMYGQMTAIAREFNFPSTTGLCLYPHFVENGITMTPRISDESWPLIWAHVFEASTPSVQRSPINGKIEFDIDLRQARWYASWISSSHREYVDQPFPSNSTAPSLVHFRADSKATFRDDQVDDQEDSRMITPESIITAPTARHIPRKLSLVDRFDSMSSRSASRPASRSALSPPEQLQLSSQILSPIFQEEEPKSARHALDSRVKTWRASAVLKPTPLSNTGQTSLEPANMPNDVSIDDGILETPDEELNLADFAWSISSAGPNEYDPMSPMSWDRVPSVHIANRMEGSVCMTPSDCTSFGPSDYTLPSPGLSIYRLPSPDIAYRMYEDVPPTPTTATSWGAPLSYPPSPLNFYRAPSIDIGERLVYSRPVTPSTATSWGPASWPSSPLESEHRPRSIHLGDRGEYSRPVTPSTATSWGAPLSYPPSPTTPFYVNTPDMGYRALEDPEALAQWVYPTNDQVRATPWALSWPYRSLSYATKEKVLPATDSRSVYPRLVLYKSVYPHFDLYPAVALGNDDICASSGYPHFNIYPPVQPLVTPKVSTRQLTDDKAAAPWAFSWPYHGVRSTTQKDALPVESRSVYPRLVLYKSVYPHFDLYPTVTLGSDHYRYLEYPHFNIYPAVQSLATSGASTREPTHKLKAAAPWGFSWPYHGVRSATRKAALLVESCSAYPRLVLYQSVYPNFDLYPAVALGSDNHTSSGYPHFNIYPAVHSLATSEALALELVHDKPKATPWAFSWPYRGVRSTTKMDAHPVESRSVYPRLVLYQSAYPHFDLYPAVVLGNDTHASAGYPHFSIYPPVHSPTTRKSSNLLRPVNVKLSVNYPAFNLYPAIYPGNVYNIYPSITVDDHSFSDQAVYPNFVLYPPTFKAVDSNKQTTGRTSGYPYFNLYPALDSDSATSSIYKSAGHLVGISVRVNARYPSFDLYPAVYPYVSPYPHALNELRPFVSQKMSPRSCRSTGYPDFNLYPPVERSSKELSVHLDGYPIFNLYPAIYPAFDIYPTVELRNREQFAMDRHASKSLSVRISRSYPSFDLYPAVYPCLEIYPVAFHHSEAQWSFGFIGAVNYPNFNLYPVVYPYFDLYLQTYGVNKTWDQNVTVKLEAHYPAFDLYPAVYPHFDLWPIVNQPQMLPMPLLELLPNSLPKPSSRLTHSELHAMVMMERVRSTGSFRSMNSINYLPTKTIKSHHDLHHAVFPSGIAVTPSGTGYSGTGTSRVANDEVAHRRVSTLRPSSRLPPPAPSPTRRLPPPPSNGGSRLSSAFESIPTLEFESGITPVRVSPSKISPQSRLHALVEGETRHGPGSLLNRPSSVVAVGSPMGHVGGLDRSASLSTTPRPTRRRDSIVLQRVRAFNSPQDSIQHPVDTISKFPAPPLPPIGSRAASSQPQPLDRSKYSTFSR